VEFARAIEQAADGDDFAAAFGLCESCEARDRDGGAVFGVERDGVGEDGDGI
jgi:hypothetical protein